MRILALETSGTAGSVAALSDLDLLAEFKLPADRGSAQTLAPAMQMVLARAGWRPSQVELVSVTAGPGSFTGLRVGVTTAKVFAYCNKAAILGLDTLEVIAFAVPAEIRRVSVALDAQRGQVTARDFSRNDDGGLSPMGPPRLVDWTAWLSALPAEVSITGPLLRRFAHRLPAGLAVLPQEYWFPTASAVGRLAARQFASGRRDDVWSLVPRYSRKSAAEEKWENQAGRRR
ncbi:MAG: tRNA (adenosine(37)-N6)-threonylcarbamoyltransferase complex dimerization subunit type 1 TsaB [Thermoguttaceae bacterium]